MAVYGVGGPYAYNNAGSRDVPGADGLSFGLSGAPYGGQPLQPPVRESDVISPANLYAMGDAPVTVIVSSSAPTRMSASTCTVVEPDSATMSRLTVLKPVSVKVTV